LGAIPQFYRVDFAYATRTVFYVMAGIMAVATIVALSGLRRGLQEERSEVPGEAGVPGEARRDAVTEGAAGAGAAGAAPEAAGTTGTVAPEARDT
jgi:hypothetical protein